MKKKVNVVIVTDVPQLSNPEIQQGIRDKAEAESWATARGYSTVYLLLKRQRVYADRLTIAVHAQAKALERKSVQLVRDAERGGVLFDFAFMLALGLLLLLLLGAKCGWPW